MKTIDEEIATSQGIYPYNKRAMSVAKVARRAGIHPLTFHKPRYVELGKEVKKWLEKLKQGAVVGRTQVRKELGTRIREWKQMYEDLLEAHGLAETDLAVAQAKLEDALRENDELRKRIADITARRVVALRYTRGQDRVLARPPSDFLTSRPRPTSRDFQPHMHIARLL